VRLAHIADLHIGFRAYQRLTSAGINQREADVAKTQTALIDRLIAIEPDVIVIAGDVFHQHRPSNYAILGAFHEFSRLVAALPKAIVVCVAGNHDLSKGFDPSCILQLFSKLGVHVVDRASTRLRFADPDISILGVPDSPGVGRPVLRPDAAARRNVLVLHGEAAGVTQLGTYSRPGLTDISAEELGAQEWDYVALGHYHQSEHLAPNVAYSGSIDFTSTDIWREIATPKGFIERDLETGAETFHELPPSRRVVDLPAIAAHEMTSTQINDAIRIAVESIDGGMDDAIVRLVVDGVARDVARAVDPRPLREYRRRCLHLNLDLRRPEVIPAQRENGQVARIRRPSLSELLINKISDPDRFPLLADVDRGALSRLAGDYLDRVGDLMPAELGQIEPEPAIAQRGAA
jgi:DNA repair protein SbcD/Mre11